MAFIGRFLRNAAAAAAMALPLLCGAAHPGFADDGSEWVAAQALAEWLSGLDDARRPPTSQPAELQFAPGEGLTDVLGYKPAQTVLRAVTCLMNYPYKATWPGPFSGIQWEGWSQRMKQDQTLFLAGAFTREGAWLDSVSTNCTVVQADGSWTDARPLAPTATGLGMNGLPTTQYDTLLYGVTANTGEWVIGGVSCPSDISEPCSQAPMSWKMGGSPFEMTCPKNSYVVGMNAAYAVEKKAIARLGIHCLNPLTGEKSFSGLRMTDNADGTSNGLTYQLLPSQSWSDGVFCPAGQLATGYFGYNDWSDPDHKSFDHLTGVGLVCHAYAIVRPPLIAQVGFDRPGSDIAQPEMTADDPNACAAACAANGECKAWTYVFHNVRNQTQCFLKKPAPLAIADPCCISGVKPPLGAAIGEDMPGADYYHEVIYSADPNVCADFCHDSTTCKAWTYVRPGAQGNANPVCYYKNAVPDTKSDPCCISGVGNPFLSPKPNGNTTVDISLDKQPSPIGTVADAQMGGGVAILTGIPTVPDPGAGVNFAGTWLTRVQNGRMYTLKLSQNADGTVTGGYEAGTISDGVVIANQLLARWHQGDAAGTLRFTIAPDNATFAGTWSNGDVLPVAANANGTWDGYNTAVFTGVPGGDDFTGTWTVTQSEGESYAMKLGQTGDAIVGTYDPTGRGGILTGHDGLDGMVLPHLVFDPAKHDGDGWVQNAGKGSGWFYLYPDKNHFSGIWRMADNTNGAWSAVRKEVVVASAPASTSGNSIPAPDAPKAPKVPKTTSTGTGGGTVSPPPPPVPPGNFAGDWVAMSGRNNCYDWHLTQQGAAVTGTYAPLNATINGTVTGGQLKFEWTERDANMRATATGSGLVRLANANTFGGDWWSPAAASEPAGNDPANVWTATRRLAGQPGCPAPDVAGGGGKIDLSRSRIGKLGGNAGDAATDIGGSANDNAPPPPVIR